MCLIENFINIGKNQKSIYCTHPSLTQWTHIFYTWEFIEIQWQKKYTIINSLIRGIITKLPKKREIQWSKNIWLLPEGSKFSSLLALSWNIKSMLWDEYRWRRAFVIKLRRRSYVRYTLAPVQLIIFFLDVFSLRKPFLNVF